MKIVTLDGGALEPDAEKWSPVKAVVPDADFQWFAATSIEDVVPRSEDADILVINKIRLGPSQFAQLPTLRMVAIMATGYDNVDLAAATQRGVTVCNVPEYCTESVAQHVFAMLLQFIHQTAEHDNAIRDGAWQRSGQFSFWLSPWSELAGKKMGIVGFGQIGQATARIAKAFGMEVIINSRTRRTVAESESCQWLELQELFEVCDVISLHCPQTDDNSQFVDRQLLSRMKPNSVLINTARGGLINEQDLADCLNQGTIAGACLDVVSAEPIGSENPLLTAKNCLLTPHLAWTSNESRQRLLHAIARNISSFVAGSPTNALN